MPSPSSSLARLEGSRKKAQDRDNNRSRGNDSRIPGRLL
jgi:hypothetical protein